MTLIESTALYLAFIFLLAGAVKGVVGIGVFSDGSGRNSSGGTGLRVQTVCRGI